MFFLEGRISKTSNFMLIIFAYSVQFSVTLIGALSIILCLRHNLFLC